ncbi:MAG: substrate-binding domain-containing protein [Anaerolineae bacterium]
MLQPRRSLVLMTFALVSCSSPVVPASTPTNGAITLHVYATTATLPLLNDLAVTYSQTHSPVVFESMSGNFQTMLEQIRSEDAAYLLTNHLPENESLLAWPIGQDGIAIIVNENNPVTGLSSQQLRNIYLGHVSNWSEVGGLPEDMIVLSREDGSGTRAEFEKLLMGERLTTRSAQIAPSSNAMIRSVSSIAGAIGYTSMGYAGAPVQTVAVDESLPTPETVSSNTYPLRSTIYVVGFNEPENVYREFIGWIQTPEGQRTVSQHYAPLPTPLQSGT